MNFSFTTHIPGGTIVFVVLIVGIIAALVLYGIAYPKRGPGDGI